jgi:hypothetical protein
VAITVIHPELVTGREDGFASGKWTVRPGSTLRGEASCNLTDRILVVPLGRDGTSRVVRAHELMHTRVSPHRLEHYGLWDDLSPRALECAEELRINTLVGRLGFDVGLLRDGSEKYGGRQLAENAEWPEALCFLMAVVGTGAEKDYLAGVRQGNPSWLPGLRAVRKRALALMDALGTSSLGSTRLNGEQVPSGYADSTIVLARIITQSMAARPPTSPDELRAFRRSLEPGGRRPPSGRFAALKLDSSLVMSARPRGAGVRRARPSATGTSMRYPSRLLTDDLKRAFARPTTFHGGIVVIDQSGSMDIDPMQLQALLRRAPDALVVGYSHRPGDRGDVANAWLLANRGAVATSCPSGNVGNGVDGPMLLWALGRRRGHEPVVWVTDGQVTDSHDHPDDELTAQCADLVRAHRIRLVRDLEEAARMLSANSAIRPAKWSEFGRLGRKLTEIPHF